MAVSRKRDGGAYGGSAGTCFDMAAAMYTQYLIFWELGMSAPWCSDKVLWASAWSSQPNEVIWRHRYMSSRRACGTVGQGRLCCGQPHAMVDPAVSAQCAFGWLHKDMLLSLMRFIP